MVSEMNILEKNFIFLKEYYPNIYVAVKNRERNESKYVIAASKSGDVNLLVGEDSFDKRFPIHSTYNPYREAKIWLSKYDKELQNSHHICLCGLGLAYFLEEIINQYPDKKIYIYEPDIQIFITLMETREITNILKHSQIVTVGIGKDELTKENFVNLLVSQVKGSLSILVGPSYEKLYFTETKEMNAMLLKRLQSSRSNVATAKQFGLEWTENILLNLQYFLRSTSISYLKDLFKDTPAIIVGSGPSLQEDLQYLNKVKELAIVLAAGSSIQALLKAGIRPHLVVSIDGGEANYSVFKNIDMSKIPLAAGSFIKHKILDKVKTPLLHVPLKNDLISKYIFDLRDDYPEIFSTTSVTGTAIQLAKLFGCNKIVLIGQDLSFPNNQYYSSGVEHIESESLDRKINEAGLLVENVMGGKNKTSKSMLVTLRDIENLIKYIDYENRISFINTSRYGAHIEGTEFLTMDEVYNQLVSFSRSSVSIEGKLITAIKPYGKEEYERVCRRLKHLLRELNKIKNYLLDLQQSIDNVYDHIHKINIKKINLELIEIENNWKKVTNTKLFNYVLQFTMQVQLSTYMKHVPVIVEEKDIIRKGELIGKYLGNLILQMIQTNEFLEEYLTIAINKLEEGLTR